MIKAPVSYKEQYWVLVLPPEEAEAGGVGLLHLQSSVMAQMLMNPWAYSVNYGNIFELVTKWPRLMATKEIQKNQVVLESKFKSFTF